MLRIENLTKHYKGSDKGVTELSLHVEPGDIYAFIYYDTNVKKDEKSFAYIPDNPDLYEYLTGIQYLNFIADVFGVPAKERQERIAKYADAFEITSSLGDLISAYSHGMKQKLAIISALVHKPKLMILDEPFVGLDPKAAVTLKEIMKEICDEGGAIFFSTHVLDVAEKLCNKVAIIKDGKLLVSGYMNDIVKDGDSLEDIFMEVAVNAKRD